MIESIAHTWRSSIPDINWTDLKEDKEGETCRVIGSKFRTNNELVSPFPGPDAIRLYSTRSTFLGFALGRSQGFVRSRCCFYASGVQANPDSLLTSSRYRLERIMIIHGRASDRAASQRQDPQGALRVGMFARGKLNWLLERTRAPRFLSFEIIAAKKHSPICFYDCDQMTPGEIQFKN